MRLSSRAAMMIRGAPLQAPRLQPRSGLLRPYRLLVTSPVASTPPGKTQAPAEKKGNAGKEKKEKKEESFYSATVKLPETAFDMRANSTVKEPALQQFWKDHKVYEQLSRNNPGDTYTLHDGPPYANGDLHIGHALNKILKDFINRYQLLNGRKARFVPGWDCHGLPIELKVLQSMKDEERKSLTPIKLRQEAAKFAAKTVDSQREQFKRYGVWADWDEPYVTMQPAYEAAQIEVFGKMVLNGHIYRGRKPVHWSPSSRTALAEAELEYPEGHTSRSIYVAMPLTKLSAHIPVALADHVTGASLAIWTTTPWTIPANLAVAVNGNIEYAVCAAPGLDGLQAKLIVAKDLVGSLSEKIGAPLEILAVLKGSELEGSTYRHPIFDRESPVVIGGDYITTDSGTGLVHTAPGHGQEDYQTGLKYGLDLLSPVDDEGRFTEEAGADLQGLSVLTDGNAAVIAKLAAAAALLKEEKYAHKYPYDWRTKKPTIFRATSQWFASVEGFRASALAAIQEVQWIPAAGEKRITSMTEGRSDWCISRQRKWGVPIPVFYHVTSGEPLMTEATIAHIRDLIRAHGSDVWWTKEVAELLPEGLRAQAGEYRKGEDTMDVWFDSGSSWAGVIGTREGLRWPADLYLEGSDQHRGWFQSSLLTSVAAEGKAPYKSVLTHGFVLDEKGLKMSKSLGNVVDPRAVIEGGKDQKKDPPYGADVLRLWVSSVDYTSDVMIGPGILKQTADTYRKLRITVRFLLGNLADFDPAKNLVAHDQLPKTDVYMLHRYRQFMGEVKDAYEAYQFARFSQAIQRFCVVDLSNFYLDVAKDRLYSRALDSTERRACQTVLFHMLQGLLCSMAPVLPHMAEDAWQNLPFAKPSASVFTAGWAQVPASFDAGAEVEAAWATVLAVKEEANKVMDLARREGFIGAPLEAALLVHVEDAAARARLQSACGDASASGDNVDALRYVTITSAARVVESEAEARLGKFVGEADVPGVGKVVIGVVRAEGVKCNRCWNYSTLVGAQADHPLLCERCVPVVRAMGFAAPAVPVAATH